mmetsp:Transcript_40645/g.61961  ORF Transcript_40645/g.61961 Transcript_40645/m.61961 type:complete len:100 (+) Transcript_40645:1061-1360(+)
MSHTSIRQLRADTLSLTTLSSTTANRSMFNLIISNLPIARANLTMVNPTSPSLLSKLNLILTGVLITERLSTSSILDLRSPTSEMTLRKPPLAPNCARQ